MPIMRESEFTGRVTYLGCVDPSADTLRAVATKQADLTFEGMVGERHFGRTRESCVRVKNVYPQGADIHNERQLSILSAEELSEIGSEIGLIPLDPQLLGASMVIEGIPDFTYVPPSSRLQFPYGATVIIDMENRPCVLPGREIETDHPGLGKAFKAAAKGRRGVTAWVARPGSVALGDSVKLFVPDQRVWAPNG